MININPYYLLYVFPLALFSGPFFSDLYISLSSLVFVIILFLNKNSRYCFKYIFSKLFFLWYLIILASSLFSNYILISLESSLLYFRFGLFFIFIFYLIDKNINYLSKFLIFLILGLFFLILDGYFQYLTGYNTFGFEKNQMSSRKAGFYKDELIFGSVIIRTIQIYFAI